MTEIPKRKKDKTFISNNYAMRNKHKVLTYENVSKTIYNIVVVTINIIALDLYMCTDRL